MRDDIRLLAAAALFGGWLVLFFFGFTARGLIHLMPAAALFLAPWRAARAAQVDSLTTPKEKS